MAHVFITHIHEESELTLAIKMFLAATVQLPPDFMMMRKPLDTFMSSEPGKILPGEDQLARLQQELASAKVVINLLTRGSLKRPWVDFETGAAGRMGRHRSSHRSRDHASSLNVLQLMFYSYGWQGLKVCNAVMLAMVLVFLPWLWSKRLTHGQ